MIDRVMSGQEPAEAYVDAGLNPVDDPEKKANAIMKKDQNQAYMAKILDDHGATDEKIAKTLAEGMDANKVTYRKVLNKTVDADGKKQAIVTMERLEDPDRPERRQSAMAAAELKGHRHTKGDTEGATVVRVYAPFSPRPDRQGDIPDGLAIEVRHER